MSETKPENRSGIKPETKPDKNSRKNVIRFALVISFVCSLLISVSASGLKDRQNANIALDRRVNLLRAANLVESGKKPPGEVINTLYDAHIEDTIVDANGKILDPDDPGASSAMHVYLYRQNEKIEGYILPFNSRGLWGKIQGYLAFKADGQTVSGFSVYSHSETPGLGGEIESAWFQKNFKGKKIVNSQNEFVSVGIAKGKVENLPESKKDNYVDGISGATLTGQYLAEGIKSTLVKYDAVSVTFRQGGLIPKDMTRKEKTEKEMTEKNSEPRTSAPGAGRP
ncbi:MAG: FMN-binding protein [Desulfobacterium sp.]|jgi:Na+-transporting NADH:ubiquinone oxidoreductase subunit C|nr:FMN-binding protein [Desulfobacterium sp.]